MNKLFARKALIQTCLNRSSFYSTKPDIHEIIATQLELDHNTVKNVYQRKLDLNTQLPEKQIVQNCWTLKKLIVDMQNTRSLMECLRLEPKILTNRILLLEEMGVKTVTLDDISRFPNSMRKKVNAFKKRHKIPIDQDIVKNMFNSIGISELPNMRKLTGGAHTADYYLHSMTYYKTCYLKLYHEPLLRSHLFKYQSFRQLAELINIFETKFKVDKTFLNRHYFVLDLNPADIINFLNEFKDVKIGGLEITEVVRRYPRILQCNIPNTKELLNLLNEYNVQNHMLHSNLPILRMKPTTFLERYRRVSTHPEFEVWLKHSRMLYLLIAYKLTMDRLDVLRLMNRLGMASFHAIYCSRNLFHRVHTPSRYPRVARKKYLKYLFEENFNRNGQELVDYITRHPHWKSIPFSAIYKMILFLKKNYSEEDIISNLHLTLYPLHAVSRMLEIVNEQYNSEKGFNDRQRLALCLYMLEKTYHFSGDAVWKIMHTADDLGFKWSELENMEEIDFENLDETYPEHSENCTDSVNAIDKQLVSCLTES
ncbi:mitochondrial transcription termination factor 5 [Lasioglossum baleicum]|uniref:mitochondrial transcription termination factor 5 n=1 Tax=Lasioglossum baleicum TaxID=434251 RepID=UPI003FCC90B2